MARTLYGSQRKQTLANEDSGYLTILKGFFCLKKHFFICFFKDWSLGVWKRHVIKISKLFWPIFNTEQKNINKNRKAHKFKSLKQSLFDYQHVIPICPLKKSSLLQSASVVVRLVEISRTRDASSALSAYLGKYMLT